MKPIEIKALPQKQPVKELTTKQMSFELAVQREVEVDGIGMGVLSDGTPFLTGRGLARLLDIENLHIRTISLEWSDVPAKPRVEAIKKILGSRGFYLDSPHIEVRRGNNIVHAYSDVVCLAVLEYYAFDAAKPREAARTNYRLMAGKALSDFIYSHVGYDKNTGGGDKFKKWHERIALNHQSAPKGYFSVFNEAHTIIYELIVAGADIDENFVVDISIGSHWGKHWIATDMDGTYGARQRWQHRYPDDHPQAKSNPQDAWCYPIAALGDYREWLQSVYIEGGKFRTYLSGKVKKGSLAPSIAQLALGAIEPQQIAGPPA